MVRNLFEITTEAVTKLMSTVVLFLVDNFPTSLNVYHFDQSDLSKALAQHWKYSVYIIFFFITNPVMDGSKLEIVNFKLLTA
jgi:hypothetical protein